MVLVVSPRWTSVNSTAAPGITAFDGSVISPTNVPLTLWASRAAENAANRAAVRNIRPLLASDQPMQGGLIIYQLCARNSVAPSAVELSGFEEIEMRPHTEGVLESSLYVDDIARSPRFYKKIFGFP